MASTSSLEIAAVRAAFQQRPGAIRETELDRAGAVGAHFCAQQLHSMGQVYVMSLREGPQHCVVVGQQTFEPSLQRFTGSAS